MRVRSSYFNFSILQTGYFYINGEDPDVTSPHVATHQGVHRLQIQNEGYNSLKRHKVLPAQADSHDYCLHADCSISMLSISLFHQKLNCLTMLYAICEF